MIKDEQYEAVMEVFTMYEELLHKFISAVYYKKNINQLSRPLTDEETKGLADANVWVQAVFPGFFKLIYNYQGVHPEDAKYNYPFSRELVQEAREAYEEMKKQFVN